MVDLLEEEDDWFQSYPMVENVIPPNVMIV
jgi:hypothetical protein